MTKLLVIPSNLKILEEINNYCDGLIIGVENFSVNTPLKLSLNEIKNVVEKYSNSKDIFVSVNKNIHNEEINKLIEVLQFLDSLSIKGIIYYDIAVVELKKKLDLKSDLVWNQEHLTTNYATCNFWQKFGVDYAYLSSDITLHEICDIKKNTSVKLLVTVFGYLPMFASYRHLVNNYLKTFSLPEGSGYEIEKEGKSYKIIDNNLGSFVYSDSILNGISEYLQLRNNNIDYLVLNSFQIDDTDFTKIVKLFANANEKNVNEYSKQIEKMYPNSDRGFFYKETVYKVKNNE